MTFLLVILYMVPAIVAAARKKSNAGAICVLNLVLGWTVIGWCVALVWASANDAKS
jgi:hypothetical protein